MTAIVWLRNELRLRDNEVLEKACSSAERVVPVYILNPSLFQKIEPLGLSKTGAFRTRFLLECLSDLRQELEKKGSSLLVLQGNPEELLPSLAKEYQAQQVFCSSEIAPEEVQEEESVEKALWKHKISLERIWTGSLFHLDDLAKPLSQTPDVFTQFRKDNEKMSQVRAEVQPNYSQLIHHAMLQIEPIPDLTALGFEEHDGQIHSKAAISFKGGEQTAWARLHEYFWEGDHLKNYKWTRNKLLGINYSSKFSAWLSLGCISPKSIYYEVKKYESERKKNVSTYWLIFELIWRDYFRFAVKKYGYRFFIKKGIKDQAPVMHQDEAAFQKWVRGETGDDFVDANMKELALTGYMSNRGRQNVASYLVKDLKVNWLWGASYFESILIDYDPCSNWGNWAYVAGVGNDPRENRYFNTESQAKKYDPQGEYRSYWLEA